MLEHSVFRLLVIFLLLISIILTLRTEKILELKGLLIPRCMKEGRQIKTIENLF